MNHAHNSVKNKINKTKNKKSTSQLGRPEQIRWPAKPTLAYASAAQKQRSLGQAPASVLQRLTMGTRTSVREIGEEERTVA